jgi:glycosyltransferase involved in cell wall biosynthesis
MKIGINLLPFRKNLTGTGVYALNIVEQLRFLDAENKYFLFCNKEIEQLFEFKEKNFIKIVLPVLAQNSFKRILWEQLILPVYLKKSKIDVLFTPSVAVPVLSKCKHVVCIHDLIPFHTKGKYSWIRSEYIKQITRISAKKAAKVLTVSENSKLEIQRYCQIAAEKIYVTYNGFNKKLIVIDEYQWQEFKKAHRIPNHYILFVGTLEPGKNIESLISAYGLLKRKYKFQHKLVIAGGKGWLFDSIFEQVSRLNLSRDVIFTGYVPDDILGALYSHADLFVLPSLYEGFGIPILEAMNFGVSVITSNISAMPEVAGDAAILVDPLDIEEIANAMQIILGNPGLHKEMSKKGKERAANFSWEKAAKIVYERLNECEK